MKNARPARQSVEPTVLLVDDIPEYRRILERRLRLDHGVLVLHAGSAIAALTILEDTVVDVVVSDRQMPGMDGQQLLAIVGKRWPHTRRILLTAYSTGEMVANADYEVLDKGLEGWLITAAIADLARKP